MTNKTRIEMIEDALELIEEAKGLVEDALRGTSLKDHFNAYNKYGFNQLQGNGNPYDSSLNSLIEELEE